MIFNIKISDGINIFLTALLVLVAYLQFNLSSDLAKIQKTEEQAKIQSATKDIRKICREIIDILAIRGASDPLEQSKEENLKLAKNISNLLQEGFDNYLLVQDQESFRYWLNAVDAVYFYEMYRADEKVAIVSGEGQVESRIETDQEFNKSFKRTMRETVLNNVVKDYLSLKLLSPMQNQKKNL